MNYSAHVGPKSKFLSLIALAKRQGRHAGSFFPQCGIARPDAQRLVEACGDAGRPLVGVEVKATQRITENDTAGEGLRQCAHGSRSRVSLGILLSTALQLAITG